jgi:hypothetical protein
MSDQENTESQDATPNALTAAELKKRELVNFVANNILNSLTMNQTIQVIQQVAMRDANTIVSEADETKLKEIEASFEDALTKAREGNQEAEAPATAAPVKKTTAKKAKSRKSAKKAAA